MCCCVFAETSEPRRTRLAGRAQLLAAVLALACSSGSAPLVEELEAAATLDARGPRWPSSGGPVRIRYLGAIDGRAGFDGGGSLWTRVRRAVTGERAPEFVRPSALCLAGTTLAVADPGAASVHLLDVELRRWETLSHAGPDRLVSPVGVACAQATAPGEPAQILVSDSVLGTVFAYDLEGNFLGAPWGMFERPTGLAVVGDPRELWVAETGAHRVRRFDFEGAELANVGVRGSGPGEFNFPTYLAADRAGGAWVTDSLNFRLQQIAAGGEPRRLFGGPGDRPGSFARPRGAAVDSAGRVFAVDGLFDAVQIFSPEGELLLVFGERGAARGQMWLPADVAIDERGAVFVSDSYNRRVQVFAYSPPEDD